MDVYTGSALSDLQSADSPCDGTSRGWTPHCKRAYVTAGTRYRIAVDGYEASNTLSWQLFTAPTNDAFANPVALDGLDVSFPAIEDGGQFSTSEPGEPQHYYSTSASHSVWYQWRATWNSEVTISVSTGGYVDGENCTPVFMSAYTGSSLTSLSRVASDSGNEPECGYEDARVSFTAVAGTTYRIAVDSSWHGDAGRLRGALQAAPICRSSGATTGNDTLTGTAGNDVLCGLEGDDQLKGLASSFHGSPVAARDAGLGPLQG